MISNIRDGFFVFGNTDPALGGPLYAFAEPVAKAFATSSHSSTLQRASGVTEEFTDPFGALTKIVSEFSSDSTARSPQVPRLAGFFGYELLHVLERVPAVATTSYDLPLYCVYAYAKVFKSSSNGPFTKEFDEVGSGAFWNMSDAEQVALLTCGQLLSSPADAVATTDPAQVAEYALVPRQAYVQQVQSIRENIRNGLVYQVNLSQQFRMPFRGSAWELFSNTVKLHPSAFSAFLQCGEPGSTSGAAIVSQSPELFCKCSDGRITIKPIKGTRKRGATLTEDLALEQQLRSSPKDLAELAMIVDLERNDLGRVCLPGSVRVEEHARVERLSHVFHLVSEVSGTLSPDLGLLGALRAIFPCGSITGAPKIAAMQIIAELEQRTRGIYTGALGVITSPREFLLSVAIRTGAVVGDEFIFNAGGGVVYDSEPELEYEETLIKAKSLFDGWLATVA